MPHITVFVRVKKSMAYIFMDDFTLIKYRSINKYLLQSLVSNTVYCASPPKLNDPFDCQVYIARAARNAIPMLTGIPKDLLEVFVNTMENTLSELQNKIATVAVCSFSLDLENPLLWSHYGDEHRGLCLTYEFPETFLNDKNKIIGIDRVEYDENPLRDFFIKTFEKDHGNWQEFFDQLMNDLVIKTLTIKGDIWGYESEVRIIRENEGPFKIDKGHLKQICFGLDTPESDIKLVRKLADNLGYSANYCRIRRCEDSDFGIKAFVI